MKQPKMKQLKRFVLFLSVVIAITGCSQDDFENVTGNDDTGKLHEVEVTFVLGANSGIQTRSTSRPINSSDNWQRVSNMRIYVFKGKDKDEKGESIPTFDKNDDSQYFYYKPQVQQADGSIKEQDYFYVPDFYKDDDWGEVWGDDKTESENECHSYSIKPLLTDGYYKFLAVGRDDIDEVNYPSPTSLANMKLSDPNLSKDKYPEDIKSSFNSKASKPDNWDFSWGDYTTLTYAYITSVTKSYALSEVFSGCSEAWYVTSDSKGFVAPITLKRAVAGLLMYVKNIPIQVEATLSLGKKTISGGPGKPATTSYAIEAGERYDVTRVAICQLILNKNVMLSSNGLDEEFWAYMNSNKELQEFPISINDFGEEKDETCYTGVYFIGCCLAPIPAPSSSMELAEGMPASVKIPSDEDDLKEGETQAVLDNSLYLVFFHNSKITGGSSGEYPLKWIPIQMKTGERKFSIDANYFYSVGDRNKEKEIYVPIDLRPGSDGGDGGNEIVITVHPNWEGVTNIEL